MTEPAYDWSTVEVRVTGRRIDFLVIDDPHRPTVSIRQTDDLDLVHELDRQCFPHDRAMPEAELNDSVWWLAYADEEPVGFAGLTPHVHGANKAYMVRAGVCPAARGGGIQKRLVRARVAYCRRHNIPRVYTYVWAGNIASMRSLISCGFMPYYWERTDDPMTLIYLERKLA